MADALFEKVALELEDRLGDFDDGALTLLDAVDQPASRAQAPCT